MGIYSFGHYPLKSKPKRAAELATFGVPNFTQLGLGVAETDCRPIGARCFSARTGGFFPSFFPSKTGRTDPGLKIWARPTGKHVAVQRKMICKSVNGEKFHIYVNYVRVYSVSNNHWDFCIPNVM